MEQLDVTIFQPVNHIINCSKAQNDIIASCSALKRIAVGLKYYEMLLNDDNKENEDIFIHFNQQVYKNKDLLNDYIHFMKTHNDTKTLSKIGNELRDMYAFTQCNIANCHTLQRHYRTRRNETYINSSFDCECYDRIHHQFFHLFMMGLRSEAMMMSETSTSDDNKTDIDFSCVDSVFKQKRDLLKAQRKKCGLVLERFNAENNKYNLTIMKNDNNTTADGNTFLDGMCEFISYQNTCNSANKDDIELKEYLRENEYDSDSIKQDLDNTNNKCSNIWNHIQNKICVTFIHDYTTLFLGLWYNHSGYNRITRLLIFFV